MGLLPGLREPVQECDVSMHHDNSTVPLLSPHCTGSSVLGTFQVPLRAQEDSLGQLPLYPENTEVQGLQVTYPPVVQRLQTGNGSDEEAHRDRLGCCPHIVSQPACGGHHHASLMAVRRVCVRAALHSSL